MVDVVAHTCNSRREGKDKKIPANNLANLAYLVSFRAKRNPVSESKKKNIGG